MESNKRPSELLQQVAFVALIETDMWRVRWSARFYATSTSISSLVEEGTGIG
jgi:hypothetical protein